MRALVVLFLLVAIASAQEKEAADKVLAAFQAKDAAALEALAKNNPDPWRVADELCSRGARDAAAAFAKAAPGPGVAKLPAYVASYRENAAGRKALATALRALRARNYQAVLAASDAKGGDVVSVRLLLIRGSALSRLRRPKECADAFRVAADAAERLGWLSAAASACYAGGLSAWNRSDWAGAKAAWDRRLEIEEALGSRLGVAAALSNVGSIHLRRGAYAKALECFENARAVMEEMGDLAGAALALTNMGISHSRLGDYAAALANHERALGLAEKAGNRAAMAAALINIGNTKMKLGAYTNAREYFERGLKEAEAAGHRRWAANAVGGLGDVHMRLGSYASALEYQKRAMALQEELGNRLGVAGCLEDMGNIHSLLGSYAKALGFYERALRLKETIGDRVGVAMTVGNIGLVYQDLGRFAKALAYQERALQLEEELENRDGIARALANLGNIHETLGSYKKALACHERALRLWDDLGNRAFVATTLGNIGNIYKGLREPEKALTYLERALKLEEVVGDRAGVARTLGNIGVFHMAVGDFAKALRYQQRSLQLREELEDRSGVAVALCNIGDLHLLLGSPRKALEFQERSRALSAELGALEFEVRNLWGLARTNVVLERYGEALRAARRGVAKLPLIVGGLAEEQGASARDPWAGLLDVGVHAGMQLNDAAEVSFFLESGRAGALLESLGGRKELGAALIPNELREQETAARAAVIAAQARHGRALAAKKRREIRAARKALDAAHRAVLDAVGKIQRAAKAAADVTYPEARPLAEIQATLPPGEALVSYAILGSGETVALVATRKTARTVALGKLGQTPRLDDPKRPWAEAAARLRAALIEPLGLGEETTRLLVSPSGALSYIPFSVLAPDREVVYVPSGTTYTVLRDDKARRGEKVLALGDPDYGTKRDARAASVYGPSLPALPGTRAEAKAVGDVVLLGKDATESRLAAALAKGEWRAVPLRVTAS